MATIETRRGRDGRTSYRARVRVFGHPERTKTFTRKTDAKTWAEHTESDLGRGRYVPTGEAMRRTLAQLVDRYLDETLPLKPRNRDAKGTRRHLLWWKKQAGGYTLANLTAAVINEQKVKLARGKDRGKPRAASSVNHYLHCLGACLKTAVREYEWLEASPMVKVAKLEEPRGRVRFLDDDERQRLLDACENVPDLYAIVVLALSTGARRGEILGLRWCDVDLQRGVIVLHDTKNRDRRVLPLAGSALELMRERAKVRKIDDDRVFVNAAKPGAHYNLRRVWPAALAEANIEHFRFHDLRHSAASYLAMNGATLAEISGILGHRTLAMVKRYAHLTDSHVGTVVAKMNAAIFPRK
jgi:integrase